MTSRLSVAFAALALVLATGGASQAMDTYNSGEAHPEMGGTKDTGTAATDVDANQGFDSQGQPLTTTTTVGRSTPSTGMDATGTMMQPPGYDSSFATGVPVQTPVMGTWNGIEITPDMVWKAIRQQGMRPLTGFLVRYGDVVVTDAALGDRNVKVAYDPRTNMIREVQ
jgi:hypothetical protein